MAFQRAFITEKISLFILIQVSCETDIKSIPQSEMIVLYRAFITEMEKQLHIRSGLQGDRASTRRSSSMGQ